jgi:hypothetical protein
MRNEALETSGISEAVAAPPTVIPSTEIQDKTFIAFAPFGLAFQQ